MGQLPKEKEKKNRENLVREKKGSTTEINRRKKQKLEKIEGER